MFLQKIIKQDTQDMSKWFRAVVIVCALIYVGLWFFSIHISRVEESRGIYPLLPAAPKDSIEYVKLSESLMSGNGLTMDGRLETLRLPGYPLFVGVIKTVFNSYFAVTLIQIILIFASALVIRRIGILFSGKKVGEIAATIFLINPVSMTLALLILTDVLFLFLFTLGLYLIISACEENKWKRVVFATLLFIASIYVRGMGIFALPIFLLPVFASKLSLKSQFRVAIALLLGILISAVPWIMRNYEKTGVALFNSFESVNLSWAVPKFVAATNGTDEEAETLAFQKATGVPEAEWRNLGWHDIRYSKQISAVGERIILSHPLSYAKFHLITSMPFLFPSSILFMRDAYDSSMNIDRPFVYGSINALIKGDWTTFYKGITKEWWKFGERILWLLGVVLMFISLWFNRKGRLAWLFVFIVFFLMMLSGPAAGPRLSFQAWPCMFILFASGGIYLCQYLRKKFSGRDSKIG
ncbi:MAG TPA: glycosyltransferase family 39 protein [Candidatus Paceibacterota bacterium]